MATLRETLTTLDSILQTLVCSNSTLHDRLTEVAPKLKELSERDIPPDFRKDFKALAGLFGTFHTDRIDPDLEYNLALAIYQINKRLVAETGVLIGFPKKY